MLFDSLFILPLHLRPALPASWFMHRSAKPNIRLQGQMCAAE